jgi:hypothetical protein
MAQQAAPTPCLVTPVPLVRSQSLSVRPAVTVIRRDYGPGPGHSESLILQSSNSTAAPTRTSERARARLPGDSDAGIASDRDAP